ncbi:MAG: acyl-CoA dehydrogenase family protein, partial [Roseovarius sp.]|nr:acyl-CoA dehydrogenase family protein [Roseovarius sp.]
MYGTSPDIFLTEEQRTLRSTVARLTRERIAPRAAEIDQKAEYPHDIFDLLRRQGIIGM